MTEHRQETTTIDELSDDVTHHFAEQRDFITFCFDRARHNLTEGLAGVRERLTGVENRQTSVESRLAGVEGRLDSVDGRLARVERRLDRHEDLLGEILTEVRTLPRQNDRRT